MSFANVTRGAAKQAEKAAILAMSNMRDRYVHDEDDVTAFFVGSLQTTFASDDIDGVSLTATVLRHRRGMAAEERRTGADLLIYVAMDTPTQVYSKGVLIQAKKEDKYRAWSKNDHGTLVAQCSKMLAITPAAFVFSYGDNGLRCGAASRIAGASVGSRLRELCGWSAYRFFLELFRCPIGDPRITSAVVDELPIPFVLKIDLVGDLDIEFPTSQF